MSTYAATLWARLLSQCFARIVYCVYSSCMQVCVHMCVFVCACVTQVTVTKEACIIVGDGSTQKEVEARVRQIRNLCEATEQEYEREKLNERIARLSGGVAIIQVRVCVCVCVCVCRAGILSPTAYRYFCSTVCACVYEMGW